MKSDFTLREGTNIDTFQVIRNACTAGTQPTVEQRQAALKWITGPISKMEHVINHLEPAVGQ